MSKNLTELLESKAGRRELDGRLQQALCESSKSRHRVLRRNILAAEAYRMLNPSDTYDNWVEIIQGRTDIVRVPLSINTGIVENLTSVAMQSNILDSYDKMALILLLTQDFSEQILFEADGIMRSEIPIEVILEDIAEDRKWLKAVKDKSQLSTEFKINSILEYYIKNKMEFENTEAI